MSVKSEDLCRSLEARGQIIGELRKELGVRTEAADRTSEALADALEKQQREFEELAGLFEGVTDVS